MFVRPVLSAENAIKEASPQLIPQIKQTDINDGRFFDEAKLITVGQNLYSYNRKVETTDMPRHSIGYDFAIDRTIEPINPAKAYPNPPTPPEILSRIAVPDLPPKLFGL